MDTAKCTAKGGSVDAFFNNFDKVRESTMYPTDGRNAPPDCLMLALGCARHCSVTAPGLATVACAWGCWCAFCGGLSGFASVLCDA